MFCVFMPSATPYVYISSTRNMDFDAETIIPAHGISRFEALANTYLKLVEVRFPIVRFTSRACGVVDSRFLSIRY